MRHEFFYPKKATILTTIRPFDFYAFFKLLATFFLKNDYFNDYLTLFWRLNE